jgi:hypothetical protein
MDSREVSSHWAGSTSLLSVCAGLAACGSNEARPGADASATDGTALDATSMLDDASTTDAAVRPPEKDAAGGPHDSAPPPFDAGVRPPRDAALPPDTLPPGVGWHELPNTAIAGVCYTPSPGGNTDCSGIPVEWSSAVYDSLRRRYVLFGGGHNDYAGNELYAIQLDANPAAVKRLSVPSNPDNNCGPANSDGTPASRHTYSGIVYMANDDRMFLNGGAEWCSHGGLICDTWTLDMNRLDPALTTGSGGTSGWTNHTSSHTGPDPQGGGCLPGAMTAYDPDTGSVYVGTDSNTNGTVRFDYASNAYVLVSDGYAGYPGTMALAKGAYGKLLVALDPQNSGHLRSLDLSQTLPASWVDRGDPCGGLASLGFPDLIFDPVTAKLLMYTGNGDSLSVIDPTNWSCISTSYAGGPKAPSIDNGHMNKMQYSDYCDCFVTANDGMANAFALRLR